MPWSIPHRVSFSIQMGFAASTTSPRDLRRTGGGIFNLAERGREAPEIVNGSGVFHRRHVGAVCVPVGGHGDDCFWLSYLFAQLFPRLGEGVLLNRVHRRPVANEK